jgi:glycosyltransferase involved in cell wall biosynthesis
MSGLTLGLLPPLNSGLQTLAQAGQHTRLIEQYFRAYAGAFEETLYFSYIDERLQQYTDDPTLCRKTKVLPGEPGRLYTFHLPVRWRREMRRCHVLRVFQITGAIPAAIARVLWRIPFAVTYGYPYAQVARTGGHRRRALMLWILEQIGLCTANAIIVTTPALATYVKRRVAAQRVHVIPNSVDTERFRPAPHLPGKRRLVSVGRLEPQKNWFMLIEAVGRMQPMPQLLLVGGGSQREALVKAATDHGISMEMPGVLPHEALPAVLQTADVFVLPSLIEGHPKAVLEAMSCGLPCVGLDVPGTRDAIAHEQTGLLCPPTVDGLVAGIDRLLDDTGLASQLGQAARVWIEAHYSAQSVMQREIELLKQLAETAHTL